MRASPRLFFPRLDWIVLAATVGISLTLLFFSDNPAVVEVKNEAGSLLTYLSRPMIVVRRAFDVFQENEELRELAMSLGRENIDLRSAALENQRLRAMLEFRDRFRYPVMAANVVAYPGNQLGSRLVVDRGRKDGIRINSAALTPAGLVGKVVELSSHTAVVQTVRTNTYGVSVMIERSRAMGILRWLGAGEWTIVGLPTGEDVRIGDLIVTTGAGAVFPPAIRVGVISEVRAQSVPGSGFCRVRPFARFDSIEELFLISIVENPMATEQDSAAAAGRAR